MGRNIEDTDPKLLAKLLSAHRTPDSWQPCDLAAMIRHVLVSPLVVDLEAAFPGSGQRVAALATSVQPPIATFGDLLRHPSPPAELLGMVKDMAKQQRELPDASFPEEVLSFFYFASIAAADKRASTRLSKLPMSQVKEGLQWLLGQSWLEGPSRQLLEGILDGKQP